MSFKQFERFNFCMLNKLSIFKRFHLFTLYRKRVPATKCRETGIGHKSLLDTSLVLTIYYMLLIRFYHAMLPKILKRECQNVLPSNSKPADSRGVASTNPSSKHSAPKEKRRDMLLKTMQNLNSRNQRSYTPTSMSVREQAQVGYWRTEPF